VFSPGGKPYARSVFACSPKRNCESFEIKPPGHTKDARKRWLALQNSILNARWEGPIP
jgi:hypothetical protein